MAVTAETLNVVLAVRDDKFAKQIERATRTVSKFSRNVDRHGRQVTQSFNRMGRSAGANKAALQNTSFQLQDIITQITMGTAPTRALAVQLPQLLGGFGALGAAAGVAVGALGLFGPMLFDTGDAAKSAEESIESLNESINALKQAQSNLTNSKLIDEFGGMAVQAQKLLAIQREVAAFRAETAMDSTFRALADSVDLGSTLGIDPEVIRNATTELDNLRESIRILQTTGGQRSDAGMIGALAELEKLQGKEANLRSIIRGVDDLKDILEITAEEASEVAAMFAEVQQSRGPQEQAEAMLRLVNHIRDVTGNLKESSEEGRELHDNLVLATEAAFGLASVDIASEIGGAANEAGRLEQNLLNALSAKNALASGYNSGASVQGGRGTVVPTAIDGIMAGMGGEYTQPSARIKGKSKTGGGGSSKGGASSQKNAMQRLLEEVALNEQLLGLSDQRERVMRRLGAEAANYSETEIAGIVQRITAYETEKQALDDIRQMQEDIATTVEDSMADAFTSIIDGTKSAEDAFKDMARSIIAELFRVLVVQRLVGSFKTGGGGILGALAPVFGKASGGPVQAGNPYMVGEHGPEPFVPAQGGRILSVGQAKSAIAGGGGATISQTNYFTSDVKAAVRAEMKSYAPQLIAASKRAVSEEARRSPTFKGAF